MVAVEVFDKAIQAFSSRQDLMTKDRFLKLEEAARARAWTVARITDAAVLKDVHTAAKKAIGSGQTLRDFIDSLNDVMERRGWSGLRPWHTKLVYEQNLSMAYTAGRYDQATDAGIKYWRYLPSTSAEPRPEHQKYYGRVYKMGEGRMPPLDFGCKCDWEVVFEDELEGGRATSEGPSIPPKQEFRYKPSDYFELVEVSLADYPEELHAAIRRIAANDKRVKVRIK